MFKRLWRKLFGRMASIREEARQEALRRRAGFRERLIVNFLAGKPSLLDPRASDELYTAMVEQFNLSLLTYSNEALVRYLEAIMFDIATRLFKDRTTVRTERFEGGMDVLETLLKLLQDLKIQHDLYASKNV